MSSKREEERNEKIIRGLMKLPPNRRCINCNSLGPQYICTNFWTFVCITCSGIHREFTHRVKSVSMSKFTSQEVDALQSGGNQRARELYLKAWDPQKSRLPDNSNTDKVREFIKKVYVDKLYFQEKSTDRPPRDPQSLRNHEDQTRRASSYHSYSQSPPYDFQYEERRYGKQGPSLTRKPGSDRGLYEGKLASFLSPSRFSDHANDEGFANEGSQPRFSDYSVSGGGDPFRSDGLSPSSQRDTGSPFSDTSRDISNEAPQLHKMLQGADANNTSNGGKILHPQITPVSGSFGSFDSGSMTIKSVNSPDLPEVDLFSSPFAPQNSTSLHHSSTNTQLPDSSLPPSLSVVQDNVDLFGATFTPQNVTSIPSPGTNTVVHQPSPLNFFHGFSQPESDAFSNGGWATFDMIPQNVAMPMGTEKHAPAVVPSSDGNVIGSFNPFSVQEASYVASSSALPKHSFGHENLQNVEASVNHTRSWSPFDDPAGLQPMHSVIKSENQEFVNYGSNANKSIGVDVYEGLNYDVNVRATNESEPPSSSLLPQSSTAAAGVHMFATDHKPANPFDLPYDSDVESSNMFWNMSTLQAALPNTQAPPSYTENQPWAFQNSVPSYVPAEVPFDPTSGSLGFMVGQAQNNQVSSVHAQSHVASIGGNPFA